MVVVEMAGKGNLPSWDSAIACSVGCFTDDFGRFARTARRELTITLNNAISVVSDDMDSQQTDPNGETSQRRNREK